MDIDSLLTAKEFQNLSPESIEEIKELFGLIKGKSTAETFAVHNGYIGKRKNKLSLSKQEQEAIFRLLIENASESERPKMEAMIKLAKNYI